jgi:hypothetical protein
MAANGNVLLNEKSLAFRMEGQGPWRFENIPGLFLAKS